MVHLTPDGGGGGTRSRQAIPAVRAGRHRRLGHGLRHLDVFQVTPGAMAGRDRSPAPLRSASRISNPPPARWPGETRRRRGRDLPGHQVSTHARREGRARPDTCHRSGPTHRFNPRPARWPGETQGAARRARDHVVSTHARRDGRARLARWARISRDMPFQPTPGAMAGRDVHPEGGPRADQVSTHARRDGRARRPPLALVMAQQRVSTHARRDGRARLGDAEISVRSMMFQPTPGAMAGRDR